MDGKTGHGKKGPSKINKMGLWLEGIFCPCHDLTGKGKGPIHPGAHNHTAIAFNIERAIPMGPYFGGRFQTKRGKIRMGRRKL